METRPTLDQRLALYKPLRGESLEAMAWEPQGAEHPQAMRDLHKRAIDKFA
jgi:hypothetical protein